MEGRRALRRRGAGERRRCPGEVRLEVLTLGRALRRRPRLRGASPSGEAGAAAAGAGAAAAEGEGDDERKGCGSQEPRGDRAGPRARSGGLDLGLDGSSGNGFFFCFRFRRCGWCCQRVRSLALPALPGQNASGGRRGGAGVPELQGEAEEEAERRRAGRRRRRRRAGAGAGARAARCRNEKADRRPRALRDPSRRPWLLCACPPGSPRGTWLGALNGEFVKNQDTEN